MANRTYIQIAKGRGYVYAYQDQLYRQVKKHGEVLYLKCCIDLQYQALQVCGYCTCQ